MKVVIALPRTGSQSYYHQEIVKKNIGWLNFHEALGHGEVHHQQTHDKLLSTDKSSVKIFPWFENQNHMDMIMDVMRGASEITYLTRRDFKAQCRSMWVANYTGLWLNHNVKKHIDLTNINEVEYRRHGYTVLNKWQEVELLYSRFPGKVVALEDRIQEPYLSPYTYTGEFPDISDIDQYFELFKSKSTIFN
jgi:hypothetical protein